VKKERYDFVALGGGNAGLTAAGRVAATGRRVALIDRGPIGGLCSLNGCNPKKVLVRSTEVLDEIRRAGALGISAPAPTIAWSQVIDRKEQFTSGVTAASERSLAEQGVELLQGSPRFVAPDALAIGERRIAAAAVLIATGSTPRTLTFPGAELVGISDDVLRLRTPPARLVVIGAGVVAFEFGQVFARLGSQVTILAQGDRSLAGFDPDLVVALEEFSAGLGVTLRKRAAVAAVRRQGSACVVEADVEGRRETLAADFVLNAAGRVPSLAELDLDAGGVAHVGRGVAVDDFLRSTSNPRVFAAGDAHGRLQLSPVASWEGRIVARNLLEGDAERADYATVPKVLYTLPQLASVGLTEAEATARGLDVRVVRSDMAAWRTYAIRHSPVARATVVVDRRTDAIVGAHLFAPDAGETIHVYALAMRFGATTAALKGTVFGYPTLASSVPHTLG
jgi:glutathione reductase (NADPH)